jgi:predicted transposase/invertase (TIGR01784 family)
MGEDSLEALSAGEKWCIYFKYRKNEGMSGIIEELCHKEEGIMHAEKALQRVSRSEKQWARRLSREMSEMDYDSRMANAEEAGMEKGVEKANIVTARKLKAMGLDVGQICEATGLSPEQVQDL